MVPGSLPLMKTDGVNERLSTLFRPNVEQHEFLGETAASVMTQP